MTPLLEADGVVKRFGAIRALDGLDLVAERGELLAILGRNGAGKTTFVRMLATLTRPGAGSVRVFGNDTVRDAQRVRSSIGLAGQHATVEPLLTGFENLVMIGVLFGLTRRAAKVAATRVLERLGLTDRGGDRVATYSGGMRRRLDLGASLVGRPALLLLDEPTTGLDPASRHELWKLVRDLISDGVDVVLTTQYLEEADVLADRVVVLEAGRVVADGTPEELKGMHGCDVVSLRARRPEDLGAIEAVLTDLARDEVTVDAAAGSARWSSPNGGADAARCFAAAAAVGAVIEEITVRRPTLEEAFLALTDTPREAEVVS
ncbi:ATP-binding cassette domain-containing protein [Nocardia ninae]|uniref:Daunorubicin resistance protein DrrA family ABC transporter ATP-binding protein n=1 Tax=Nocardia ninae NBRC 108245 TaxID=1210091 RepID=A0A511M973_9NOCA|nr:ATP-binding cassette domain-containing protein [Nocardia ninae]GEM36256.1 daunorubicin resistance protein DrrA family ABC transporter ATP-binding protein [Nocardia ninae NBRC 108245]